MKIPRFERFPLGVMDKSIEVNIKGTVMVTQYVINEMIRKKKGTIINVTSTYAIVAPDQRLYIEKGKGIYIAGLVLGITGILLLISISLVWTLLFLF